jgi:hypothetical protein
VAVAAGVAGGAVIARADDSKPRAAAAAPGGLGIRPSIIETTAASGSVGSIKVENHSRQPLDVTVRARPWRQSSSGAVSVDRRRSLSGVTLGAQSFTLAAGSIKDVAVSLGGVPSGGSLYGGVEVIGLPAGASKQAGVVAGYRLIASLRLNPAKPVLELAPGAAKVTGSGAGRAVVLAVRNAGNTIDPITGSVSLKGPLGTRQRSLPALRILPRKTVDVLLSSARGLAAGAYTAKVTLEQGKHKTTVTRTLRVKAAH